MNLDVLKELDLYLAPSMEAKPAANDYVERILKPARELTFPRWYVERLESFRSCRIDWL
ncbi:MAG: hypothetical protein ND866_24580 [Pyrinomonadaceae bacterium]|nr:hypothetical protein [Pyrinomonadaceae bacterium]